MKRLLLLLPIAFLASCASSGKTGPDGNPLWVTDVYAVYSSEKNLAAVGSGSTVKEARQDASAALSQTFEVKIKVESLVESRYKEITGTDDVVSVSSEDSVNETIEASSSQTLVNVKFGETYTDKLGRVYTVAYLDRLETADLYRSRIMENNSLIERLAGKASDSSDPLSAFAYYDAASVVMTGNAMLIGQLEIISSPHAASLALAYNEQKLLDAKEEAAQQLSFDIQVKGDSEGKIADQIRSGLSSLGFRSHEEGGLLVSGEVSFESVELDNGYENIKWYLVLQLIDSQGYNIVSIDENRRSSGISESAAQVRAYKDMEKEIDQKFIKAFTDYMDDFLSK